MGSFPEFVKLYCQQMLLISEGDFGSGNVLARVPPYKAQIEGEAIIFNRTAVNHQLS